MASERKELRLLIVEDAEDDALLLVRVLKREGYQLDYHRVETAADMRTSLSQQPWDVVISDYQLPGFNALSALEIYHEFQLDIPFLVVSGVMGEETAVNVMRAGAHDYLIKDNLVRLAPAIRRELQETSLRQDRRDTLARLRRSESRYRAIVEDQTELINRSTLDGEITFANEAYARLHGLKPEDMVGMHYSEILTPDRSEYLSEHRKQLTEKNPMMSRETSHVNPDGQLIWIQWRDRLILDDQQNPIEYQGVGRDITDKKRAEDELTSFAENLERRAVQLQVAAEIARDAATVRQLDDLLHRAVDLVNDRFGYYHAAVFLIDEDGEYAVLTAAAGEAGQKMQAMGHRLEVGETGIVGHVSGSGQSRIALDVEIDSVHLAQPLLPNTRSEMALPLKVGEQIIGVLDVQSEQENAFDDEDVQILQTMADQLAIAIDNVRLLDELQHRAQELEGLYNTALVTSSELETDALLLRLYEQVQQLIAPDSFIVALYDKQKDEVQIVLAMELGEPIDSFRDMCLTTEDAGLSGYIIQTRESLLVVDAELDELPREPVREPQENPVTRAWLGVPLMARDEVIGVVSIQSFQPGAFDETHQRFLESLSSQVAIAFQNARYFEAERGAREQAETLREIVRVISRSLDLDQVLSLILGQIRRVLQFDTASVLLLDDQQTTALVAGIGYDEEVDTSKAAGMMLKDSPILQRMAQDFQPVILPDVSQDPDWVWIPGAEHVQTFMGIPIIARDRMIGAFMVDRAAPDPFTEEDARTLQAIAQHMAIAVETARLFEAERAQLLLAQTMQEVGMLLTSEIGLVELLDKILDLLGRFVSFDSASVQLLDENQQLYFASGRGVDPEMADRLVRELSRHNLARLSQQGFNPILISDTHQDELWQEVPDLPYIRSWIGVPLQSRGKLIGLLTVDRHEPGGYSEESVETVVSLANQAAIAIENAQLFEAERQARERAEALREAAQVISSTLSLNQIIEIVLEQLARVLSYDTGSVIIVEGDRARVQAGYGYERFLENAALTGIAFDLGVESIRYVVQEARPLMIPDVLDDPRWQDTFVTGHVRSWMGVPLIARDQVIGLINLERCEPGGFSQDDLSLTEVFATHTSTAIENARFFEEEEKRAGDLETLRQAGLSLTASLEPDAVLLAILGGAFQLMPGAWYANIFVYKEGTLTFGAEYWKDGKPRYSIGPPAPDGPVHQAAQSGETIVHADYALSEIFSDFEDEGQPGAIVALPLKIGDRSAGIMCVIYADPSPFSVAELRVLNLLGDQAALAMENARLFQETTAERRHIALLYGVSRTITTSLDPVMILQEATVRTCEALDGVVGAAWLYSPNEKQLQLQSFYNDSGITVAEIQDTATLNLPLGEGFVGQVGKQKQALNTPDIANDSNWLPVEYIQEDVHSMIAAPILEGENLLGVIAVQHHQVNAFDESHLALLGAICQQVSLALSNARRYQDVDRLVSLLAAEQYRLEGLIEMLPVGVLLLDDKQNLLVTNSEARQSLADLSPMEEGLTIQHLGDYALGDLLAQHDDPLPIEIIHEGPPRKIFEVEAQPIGTEKQQWVVTLREVTQEREIQDRVQMQERLATVGQLAAGIAHDFNNIMAAIVVYADLLLMDKHLSPASQERLEIIQQQVQRAASLIRQILDFSRRSVMEQNTLDLIPFTKEIEKLLQRTLPETIQTEVAHGDDVYQVCADPTRLQQVFMNLAVNARDAMPDGGRLRFAIALFQSKPYQTPPILDMPVGDWIEIRISDTGDGISPEDQTHIFEPFFTTKPVGQGTGLGLAQVYGIIKQHDGFIDVASQPGEGTQFTIYLPEASSKRSRDDQDAPPMELDGAGQTILLVEDDPATRKALQAMLAVHNYRVLLAENGVVALEHIKREADSIALIVSDIVMPQMGGLDLYEALQVNWPHLEILFITGHPLDDENQQILEQGKVHWLQKPFTVQEFNQTITDLLG